MRIVIIEDEKPNALRLKNLLHEISPAITVLEMIDTVEAGVEWFGRNPHPDVALMDVRLADGLSFDIFARVQLSCPVIFTTAYDEYAIRAFKVNSIDYLLKPIEKYDLQQALEKAGRQQQQSQHTMMQQLLGYLGQPGTTYRTRFLLPYRDGYKTVLAEEIDFVFSAFKNTHLVLKDGSIEIVSQTMEELEEQLSPDLFFRANRQHLINIHSIGSILNSFNGKLKVCLKLDPEREILISKERAPLFKQWLDK